VRLLVDAGHRKRGIHDPGQRGDVGELVEAAIAGDLLEQQLVGEHARAGTRIPRRRWGSGSSHVTSPTR
jgi:hypothetical protein